MQVFTPSKPLIEHSVCFTTSTMGGVSGKNFASFNLGAHVGDNLHDVQHNRSTLAAYIKQVSKLNSANIQPIKWLNQQHTTQVCDYTDNVLNNHNLPCDGIFTNLPLVPLAIMTADCLPIVLACPRSGEIAVIHAGWRGLLNGIIENALQRFSHTSELRVWIGPSISQSTFEVSDDVISQFSAHADYIEENHKGKYNINLPQIACQKLQAKGVVNIEVSPICSYQNLACFSHRRSTHEGFKQTGRMATVIMRST